MKLTGVELRRIAMPLVAPFRTSFGTETERDILLVRVVTPDAATHGCRSSGCPPTSAGSARRTPRWRASGGSPSAPR